MKLIEMKEIHDIAEELENRKLSLLRLCLSGFALGGLSRLVQAYIVQSDTYMLLTILQVLGCVILLISLQQLLLVNRKVKGDKLLQQIFNDELSTQTKLKSWKAGFFALLVVQLTFILLSFVFNIEGGLVAELNLFIAVTVSLSVYIAQEELLAITLFSMDVDEGKYEIWNWRKPSFFHIIINPGVVVNELLLGQRVPKVMLIDRHSNRPFMERSYVPCPSCETLHNGVVWSAQNKTAFKNWYGLYCPSCEDVIPCTRNVFSWLLIAVTYPLWFWKREAWKARWLEKQPARFQGINLVDFESKKVNWLLIGLLFGVGTFVIFTLVFKTIMIPFEDVNGDYLAYYFEKNFLILNGIFWFFGGLAFAGIMKYVMEKKGTRIDLEKDKQAD